MTQDEDVIKEAREDLALGIVSKIGREVGLETCGDCHYFEEECTYERPADYPKEIGEEPLCPQDWAFSLSLVDQILSLKGDKGDWEFSITERNGELPKLGTRLMSGWYQNLERGTQQKMLEANFKRVIYPSQEGGG